MSIDMTYPNYYPYGKTLREYITGDGAEKFLTTQHERDVETGLDYRGARFYDSDVARFLSLDPHASNYPSLSDYSYVAGSPLMFIDPDGKDIINGDAIKRDQYQDQLNGYDIVREQTIEKFGSIDNKRKFLKNGNSKEDWKKVKSFNKKYNQVKSNLETYTGRAKMTEARINTFKSESPNMFNRIDEQDVDFIMFTSPEVGFNGNNGETAVNIKQDQNENYIIYSNSGDDTVESYFDPSSDHITTKHEVGHFEYIVFHPKEYYKYLRGLEKDDRHLNGGHNHDDKSGHRAIEFEQIDDL